MTQHRPRQIVQFGAFEVDLRSGELRKAGMRVALQEQPFRILAALLEQPGELVSRSDLRRRLWPDGTFVDFEHSLNAAIRRLRLALGDDADLPRFVETLHHRGYRLVTPVTGRPSVRERENRRPSWETSSTEHRAKMAVLPFSALAHDARQDWFSESLTDETITQLARSCAPAVGVLARLSVSTIGQERKTAGEIGRTLGVDYLLEGCVRQAAERVRITSQLIDTADETHLWAEVYDRELGDCLAVQNEIAALIAREVASRLPAFLRDQVE